MQNGMELNEHDVGFCKGKEVRRLPGGFPQGRQQRGTKMSSRPFLLASKVFILIGKLRFKSIQFNMYTCNQFFVGRQTISKKSTVIQWGTSQINHLRYHSICAPLFLIFCLFECLTVEQHVEFVFLVMRNMSKEQSKMFYPGRISFSTHKDSWPQNQLLCKVNISCIHMMVWTFERRYFLSRLLASLRI